ncbi:MAG: amino acid permease [Mycetocola sp.]
MAFGRIKSIEASIADAGLAGRSLTRSLGTWDIMIMGVAVAVGAGIFSVGAKAAASYAGPSVSLSFVLAALICGLAIMCYAEFASTVPVAGSAYTFTYATLGELLAWIIGWDLILEMLTAAAVVAKYWGIYLSTVFEIGGWDVPATLSIFGVQLTWGPFLIVAVFTILLVLGTKLSSRVSSIFTVIKVAIVLFVIVAGLFYINGDNYSPFIPPAVPAADGEADVMTQSLFAFISGQPPAQYGVFGMLSAMALVFFAFIGFDVVATSAEETKDPQRTLPRGIIGGLVLVSLLYVGVSLVLTGMVPYTELARAEDPSLATAFVAVGADWAGQVIAIGSLAGLTTVIMVLLLGLARVVFAMSRDGLLPRSWSRTSDARRTPARIQIGGGILVALLAGLTNVDVLEEMINIGTLSAFVLVSIAVVVLRKKRPDLKRGFRVPFSPVLPILSAVLCVWMMLNLHVDTWIRFAIWLVLGIAVYYLYGRRHSVLGRSSVADASVDGAHPVQGA